jgi:hypothetical protein
MRLSMLTRRFDARVCDMDDRIADQDLRNASRSVFGPVLERFCQIAGAVEAWGGYWSRDPKETRARTGGGLRGR